MKKQKRHGLTDHARQRLAERSTLNEDEFLRLADTCSVLVYRENAHSHYEVVWSRKDKQGYVIVVDPETGSVITIKNALSLSGRPCIIHDERKAPSPGWESLGGTAKITSAMLEKAVLAAGAEMSEAAVVLESLRSYENNHCSQQKRAWQYRWKLRFMRENQDGRIACKTVNLGRTTEISNTPPTDILSEVDAILKAENGWDPVVSLVDRDTLAEVAEFPLPTKIAA